MGLKESGLRGSFRNVSVGISAIPDSGDLHLRISAQDDDRSLGSITTIPDQANDFNLSGSAELIDAGVNGNRSYRFDGIEDLMSVAFDNLPQPNHIFMAFEVVGPVPTDGDNVVFHDSESGGQGSNRHVLFSESDGGGQNGEWSIFAGNTINGSDVATGNYISNSLYNGSSSSLRLNGSAEISGDVGSQELDGFAVGANGNNSQNSEIDVGEILVYPEDKSSIDSDVEEYLSEVWDITI